MGRKIQNNLKCGICKQIFPRILLENNRGFCEDCSNQTKLCKCGCGELIFKYYKTNSGNIYERDYKYCHGNIGSHHSKNTIEKMKNSALAVWKRQERRTLQSEIFSKLYNTPQYKELFRNINLNRKYPNRIISQIQKDKIRESNIKTWSKIEIRSKLQGKNNPSWKGGISKEVYGIEFTRELKEYIRSRQNYICADHDNTCDYNNEKMCVHHIDQNKRNNDKSNLIALCKSHHSRAHNKQAQVRHKNYLESLCQSL